MNSIFLFFHGYVIFSILEKTNVIVNGVSTSQAFAKCTRLNKLQYLFYVKIMKQAKTVTVVGSMHFTSQALLSSKLRLHFALNYKRFPFISSFLQ